MMDGPILALDLASTVGWAAGHVGDLAPSFGTWHLPHMGGEGARYAAFENELAAAMDLLAPSHLVLEAPLPLWAQTTMRVTCQQLTLRGIAYAEGWRASCPVSEVSNEIVRSAILGRARYPKGTVKHEVVRYCRGRGFKVPDHNAADACLVWLWHTGQLQGVRAIAGPLFRPVAG